MRPIVCVLLVIGLTALSFGGAAAQGPADPLHGKRFRSVDKLAGGLSPDGKANLVHYRVSFKNGKFSWYHSDVVESGSYHIDAKTGQITAAPAAGKRKYAGSYDAKTGILTWEKIKYQLAPE